MKSDEPVPPVDPSAIELERSVQALDGGRACRLAIRAQPGARRTGFAGFWNGLPKFQVAAPPEDGRANLELVQLLATTFGLRARDVMLVSGVAARTKGFRLECSASAVAARLVELRASRED